MGTAYFFMRITHMPTGISVETGDSPPDRSMHRTKLILEKLLKSKIWLSQQKIDLERIVRNYDDSFEEKLRIGELFK